MVNTFWNDLEAVRSLLPETALPISQSELAGFYDGDGSFYIAKSQAGASMSQCHLGTLRVIQQYFGGFIHKRERRSETQRTQYTLMMRNIEVCSLIPLIKDHLVLKADRADRVMRYMDHYNLATKESQQARQELYESNADTYHFDRINKEYIRGLYCAEGCLRLYSLTICQKGCLELLERIRAFVSRDIGLGATLGKINEKEWIMTDHKSMKTFLDWMTVGLPRLFNEEKALQIDVFYAYLETREKRYRDILCDIKHENHDISPEVLDAYNKDAREFTAKLRSAAAGRVVKPNNARASPVSAEDMQRIKDLRETGMSFGMIAKEVGCTKDQATYISKKSERQRLKDT